MKQLFSILLVPLIAIAVSAVTVLPFSEFAGNAALNHFQSFVAGCGVFAVAMTLMNYINQTIKSAKLKSVEDGCRNFERQMNNRVDELSANLVLKHDIYEFQKRLNLVEAKSNHSFSGDASDFETKLTVIENEQYAGNSGSADANVIPLDLAKRKAGKTASQANPAKLSKKKARNYYKGQLKAFLHPVISVQDRTIAAYEVLARLELADGSFVPAADFLKQFQKSPSLPNLDLNIMDQTIKLLRAYRRRKQNPALFMNISANLLKSKRSFEKMHDLLKANRIFSQTLTLELPLAAFNDLTKTQFSRLTEFRDLGFQLSLDGCEDVQMTLEALDSGLFKFVKMPVSVLEENLASEDGYLNITSVSPIADKVTLIITRVEKERQIIQLIDNDISLAQGHLFSEPKLPRIDPETNRIAKRN